MVFIRKGEIFFFNTTISCEKKESELRKQDRTLNFRVSDPYSFFLRIRMEANTDPDTDPDPDPIRIQGFNDQK
jgi:hypothetical protein